MYNQIPYYQYPQSNNSYINQPNSQDDRFIGGLAFPFLLGGVTGAALAPAFWNPRYSPYTNYRPYPYYGPYYGPYYR